MSGNELDGLSVGGTDEGSINPEDKVDEVIEQLEVDDLDELSDSELDKLLSRLDIREEITGITQEEESGDRSQQQTRRRVREVADREEERLIEEQLEELRGISDDTELLQRIIAGLSTVNSTIQNTNSLLNNVVESNIRGQVLSIKDTDFVTFENPNTSRDVVDDENITTSIVFIKADATNSNSLYVGSDTVAVEAGFQIEAGEVRPFPVDILDDEFQIVAEEVGDSYSYIALGVGGQ